MEAKTFQWTITQCQNKSEITDKKKLNFSVFILNLKYFVHPIHYFFGFNIFF